MKSILSAAILAVVALGSGTAAGQATSDAAFPQKPIRLIVPTTAGSTPDVVARFVGDKLAAALGQPVIIENRGGAIGTIGLNLVAKAAPDGYTLGVQTLPYIVAPSLLPAVPYDTARDLVPVIQIERQYAFLVVPAGFPVRTVADLVALAKAKPGALKYSSPGNATPSHLGLSLFAREAGITMLHVPYKGTVPAVTALLSGDVDLIICGVSACVPHIKSGKFRALATLAPHRLAGYPDLATMAELGYPGVEITDWLGIVAPAGTPRTAIDRLYKALAAIVALPEVKQHFEAIGMEPSGAGPDAFAALIQSDMIKWNKLVRDARITAD